MLQNILYQKHQFCDLLPDISISAQDKFQRKSPLDFKQEFQQPNSSYTHMYYFYVNDKVTCIRVQHFSGCSTNPVSCYHSEQ